MAFSGPRIPAATPRAMPSLRKSLQRFAEDLQLFSGQLSQETAELRRNVEQRPITGATNFRHCLEDISERLAAVGEELQALEAVSLDAISLEVPAKRGGLDRAGLRHLAVDAQRRALQPCGLPQHPPARPFAARAAGAGGPLRGAVPGQPCGHRAAGAAAAAVRLPRPVCAAAAREPAGHAHAARSAGWVGGLAGVLAGVPGKRIVSFVETAALPGSRGACTSPTW